MSLRIKEEYLDTKVSNPMTGKVETLRFIPRQMYAIFNKSFSFAFESDNRKCIKCSEIECICPKVECEFCGKTSCLCPKAEHTYPKKRTKK